MPADDPRFQSTTFTVRRKVFRLFGGGFHVYDGRGELILYTEMKRFRIKEDFRLYDGNNTTAELLRMKARSAFDIGTTYDVVDAVTNETVGALRRKGLKSIIRDEWSIVDLNEREVATIREESAIKAVLRRIHESTSILMPQAFVVSSPDGQTIGHFKQHFNPFVYRLTADFSADTGRTLDRRLGVAAVVLLAAIEGRQG